LVYIEAQYSLCRDPHHPSCIRHCFLKECKQHHVGSTRDEMPHFPPDAYDS
jgi:hypothetical protein